MKNTGHSLSAGITVEASYVMALVLMVLAVLIRTALGQCRYTTQVMRLHHVTEQLRYQETDEERTWSHGQVRRKNGHVDGYAKTDGWEKRITEKAHEPEEILRMLTIFQQKEGQQK